MNQKFKRITVTALTLGLLAVSAIAPATSAAQPDWAMPVTVLSPTVKPGNNAGFRVVIRNDGPSNIAQLYLTWNKTEAPSYIEPGKPCEYDGVGPLYCYFGALPAYASVEVTVGYRTPAGSTNFDLEFQANTNGATTADNKGGKPGTSRGDTLTGVYFYEDGSPGTVALTDNGGNFSGDWTIAADTLVENAPISRRNLQSTAVVVPAALVAATVEDGPLGAGESFVCPASLAGCAKQFGEWSRVSIDRGRFTSLELFRVTIVVAGSAVVSGVNAGNIVVIHVPSAGDPFTEAYTISERCTLDSNGIPTNTNECIVVNKIGPNFKIDVWVLKNGAFRPGAN